MHQRDRQARLVDVAAEGTSSGPPPLQASGDDEDDRHGDRGAEPEVGALLGAQLAQLPGVDGQRRGIMRAASVAAGAAARPRARPRSARRTGPRASRRAAPARGSAQPGLDERDATARPAASSAASKRTRAPVAADAVRSRGWAWQTASARVVVGRAQPVVAAGRALELGQRALVDDRGRCGRSRRGCTAPRPRSSRWLDSRTVMPSSASRRTSARMSRMPAGSSPVAGSSSSSSRGSRSSARGDAEPLAHAVRVAADAVACAVGQLDGVERRVDARRGVAAVEGGEQLEVPAAGQVGVEARRLDEARRRRRARATPSPAGRGRTARTVPAVGRIRPSIIRSEVVLPAPLGPR